MEGFVGDGDGETSERGEGWESGGGHREGYREAEGGEVELRQACGSDKGLDGSETFLGWTPANVQRGGHHVLCMARWRCSINEQ